MVLPTVMWICLVCTSHPAGKRSVLVFVISIKLVGHHIDTTEQNGAQLIHNELSFSCMVLVFYRIQMLMVADFRSKNQ